MAMGKISKQAYIQSYGDEYSQPTHDTNKWVSAMQKLYNMWNGGSAYQDSFNIITEGWDKMEKYDFQSWMKYYQENNHLKYKTAQYNTIGGTNSTVNNIVNSPAQKADDQAAVDMDPKVKAEKLIKSIIRRLNAAESIATDPQLKNFINLEKWIETLHALKRTVQFTQLKTANSPIIFDIIVREGNKLIKNGYQNEGTILKKIALGISAPQAIEPSSTPTPTSPETPNTNADKPSSSSPNTNLSDNSTQKTTAPTSGPSITPASFTATLPSPAPGPSLNLSSPTPGQTPSPSITPDLSAGLTPPPPPGSVALPTPPPAEKKPLEDFQERLGIPDGNDNDDQECDVSNNITRNASIVVTAQSNPNQAPAIQPIRKQPSLEQQQLNKQIQNSTEKPASKNDVIDLSSVRVNDVVERLETISNILKNREIPRQLAIIDLMLDKLGIASYFPSLAEATRSSLDSNQYMATRIEDVLGKLRGSLEISSENKIDLQQQKPTSELQNNLEQIDNREKQLKDIRTKNRQDAEISKMENEQPEVTNVQQDLATPTVPVPAAQQQPSNMPVR